MKIVEKLIAEIRARVREDVPNLGYVAGYCIALERSVKLMERVVTTLAPNSREEEVTRPRFFDVTSLTAEEAQEMLAADANECQVAEEFLRQMREQTVVMLEPLLIYQCEAYGVSKETAVAFITAIKQEFG